VRCQCGPTPTGQAHVNPSALAWGWNWDSGYDIARILRIDPNALAWGSYPTLPPNPDHSTLSRWDVRRTRAGVSATRTWRHEVGRARSRSPPSRRRDGARTTFVSKVAARPTSKFRTLKSASCRSHGTCRGHEVGRNAIDASSSRRRSHYIYFEARRCAHDERSAEQGGRRDARVRARRAGRKCDQAVAATRRARSKHVRWRSF
jgi:hypothetical protein